MMYRYSFLPHRSSSPILELKHAKKRLDAVSEAERPRMAPNLHSLSFEKRASKRDPTKEYWYDATLFVLFHNCSRRYWRRSFNRLRPKRYGRQNGGRTTGSQARNRHPQRKSHRREEWTMRKHDRQSGCWNAHGIENRRRQSPQCPSRSHCRRRTNCKAAFRGYGIGIKSIPHQSDARESLCGTILRPRQGDHYAQR